MKNHEWRDGRLLQTNKQWSRLKQSQREWIGEVTRDEHAAYIVESIGCLPTKAGKRDLIDKVYDRIEKRGIWIPYGEAVKNIGKRIDKLNRKAQMLRKEVGERDAK